MKRLLLLPLLAFAAYAAEPFLARPLLVEPTNATPVSPAGFFSSNSAAINGVISSVTNVYLKGVTTLMVTPAEPGEGYKIVFHGDADSELAVASTLSYSNIPSKDAANTFTATNSMPELQAGTLVLTNGRTDKVTWITAVSADSNYVATAGLAESIWMITNVNWLHCTNMVSTTNEMRMSAKTLYNFSGYNLTNTFPTAWKRVGTAQTVISNGTVAVIGLMNVGPNDTNNIYGIAVP